MPCASFAKVSNLTDVTVLRHWVTALGATPVGATPLGATSLGATQGVLCSCFQGGMPLKQQGTHLVNCTGFIDKGLQLVRHVGTKEDWAKVSAHMASV